MREGICNSIYCRSRDNRNHFCLTRLLDDFENEMENTSQRLLRTLGKVDKALNITKDGKQSCCICLLVVILIIMIIICEDHRELIRTWLLVCITSLRLCYIYNAHIQSCEFTSWCVPCRYWLSDSPGISATILHWCHLYL